MGLQQQVITVITDDHSGEELASNCTPTTITIDDNYKHTAYLSEASRARLQTVINDFLSAPADKSDDPRMATVSTIRRPDVRFENYGFTTAEARAYAKRNGIPVGDRGLVPQVAYDGLKASEDEGCETAEEVRARLTAPPVNPETLLRRKRLTLKPGSRVGSTAPKTFARTREETATIDSTAAYLMRLLDAGGNFELVSEGEPNDRMAQAINNATGNFTGLHGFEAISKTAEPKVMGPYKKPLVDIYARRIK